MESDLLGVCRVAPSSSVLAPGWRFDCGAKGHPIFVGRLVIRYGEDHRPVESRGGMPGDLSTAERRASRKARPLWRSGSR